MTAERAPCPMCGRYPQPNVGAGALIEREGKVLLLKRAQGPFEGLWNLPAGFVELRESPAQAAVRETYEEAGVTAEPLGVDDVYHYDDDPRGGGAFIVYHCRIVAGEPAPGPEASAARFFSASEIPAQLGGGGHNLAILAWRDRQAQGGASLIEEAGE
jgi:ADP-ribose/FAD diphosphatase